MNVEQATFLADFEEHCDALVRGAREAVVKAVQDRGEVRAYEAITREADKIVAKTAVSRDSAIARVLSEQPWLYDDYSVEHARRLRMDEASDRNKQRRENEAAERREELLDSYARTANEQAARDAART